MDARWISEPLCLFDNCLETDGAGAVVITSAERARDTAKPPALIHSFAQAIPQQHQTMTNYFSDDPLRGPAWAAPTRLWANADVEPADVHVAQLYDAFSPLIPLSLEGYGFCERGEGPAVHRRRQHRARRPAAGEHVRRRHVRGVRARLQPHPRGVRQIRGESTSQVDGAEVSLVTSGEGVPTSALLLTKDTPMIEGLILPDVDDLEAAGFWDGCAAASCWCRRAARAGGGACRRGRCARGASRSTSRGR